MARKVWDWNNAPTVSPGGTAAYTSGANMFASALDNLKAPLAKSSDINVKNAGAESDANTGAYLDQILKGKDPELAGLYNSKDLAVGRRQYEKDQFDMQMRKAANARAGAAARRAAKGDADNAAIAKMIAGFGGDTTRPGEEFFPIPQGGPRIDDSLPTFTEENMGAPAVANKMMADAYGPDYMSQPGLDLAPTGPKNIVDNVVGAAYDPLSEAISKYGIKDVAAAEEDRIAASKAQEMLAGPIMYPDMPPRSMDYVDDRITAIPGQPQFGNTKLDKAIKNVDVKIKQDEPTNALVQKMQEEQLKPAETAYKMGPSAANLEEAIKRGVTKKSVITETDIENPNSAKEVARTLLKKTVETNPGGSVNALKAYNAYIKNLDERVKARNTPTKLQQKEAELKLTNAAKVQLEKDLKKNKLSTYAPKPGTKSTSGGKYKTKTGYKNDITSFMKDVAVVAPNIDDTDVKDVSAVMSKLADKGEDPELVLRFLADSRSGAIDEDWFFDNEIIGAGFFAGQDMKTFEKELIRYYKNK